jgi:hypothetical protein
MRKPVADVVLTAPQMELYRLIEDRIKRDGIAPTLLEMATVCGIARVSARERVTALVRKGLLVRKPYSPRGLRLANTPAQRLAHLVIKKYPNDLDAVVLARRLLAA